MDGLRTGREEDYEAWKQAQDRHKERGVNKHFHLNAAASKWPTPQARANAPGKGCRERGGRHSDLVLEAENWPTPGANDHKGTAKVGPRRGQLDEAAEQKFQTSPYLPGPPAPKETGAESQSTSTPLWRSPQGRDGKTKRWATPRFTNAAMYAERRETYDARKGGGKVNLADQACDHHTNKRLNPLFVEWLMGFPFGWISFEPWATPSSPSRPLSPSET